MTNKFRVWNIKAEKYESDYEFALSARGEFLIYHENEDGWIPVCPNEKDYKIEFFTGLQDKHGVDIYEGDILRGVDSGYSRAERIEVTVKYNWLAASFNIVDEIFSYQIVNNTNI